MCIYMHVRKLSLQNTYGNIVATLHYDYLYRLQCAALIGKKLFNIRDSAFGLKIVLRPENEMLIPMSAVS